MELELFQIWTQYTKNNRTIVGSIRGFCLHTVDSIHQDLAETKASIHFQPKLTKKMTNKLAEIWYYKKCSLDNYRSFEIDRLPKDMKQFSWLVFHHFNALTSNIANQADIKNKIETFLDTGD